MRRAREKGLSGESIFQKIVEKARGVRNLGEWQALGFHRQYPEHGSVKIRVTPGWTYRDVIGENGIRCSDAAINGTMQDYQGLFKGRKSQG